MKTTDRYVFKRVDLYQYLDWNTQIGQVNFDIKQGIIIVTVDGKTVITAPEATALKQVNKLLKERLK